MILWCTTSVEGAIEVFRAALVARHESWRAVGDDDRYLGMDNLAQKLWTSYENKIGLTQATTDRVGLRPMLEIKKLVLTRLLDDELSPEMAAQLRTKLNMPAVAPKAGAAQEATTAPATDSTNAPALATPAEK